MVVIYSLLNVWLCCKWMNLVIKMRQLFSILCLSCVICICVCISLLLSHNNLLAMSCMNTIPNGYLCIYPSSLSQDLIIYVIISTYQVITSPTLDEDWYLDALGFLFVNSGWTIGVNSPTLRRTNASVERNANRGKVGRHPKEVWKESLLSRGSKT